jgi:peptidoglycan/LPS O-acetylase OafA/YrhL
MQLKSNTQRIPELDGLRGIAILLVVSFHYINNQLVHATTRLAKLLYTATSFGWIGVDLFFVLSGFLICTILIANKSSQRYFSTFFIRRIVRIIPNYYLLIVVFILIGIIPFFSDNRFLTGDKVIPNWSYFAMLQNFFMASAHSMGNDAMSVTWSIGIEEQFYLVFPFIIYFIKDKWIPFVFIFLMILAVWSRMQYDHWIPPYVLLHCRMDALATGALIAWLNQRIDLGKFVNNYYRYLLLIPVIVIGACAWLFIRYQDLGVIRNSLFSIFFGFCLLLALVRKNSLFAMVLRNKLLIRIGVLSYSLYLFHYLILGIFHHFTGNLEGIGINSIADVLISIAALITSIFISWIIYVYLETPMVGIGKRFKY